MWKVLPQFLNITYSEILCMSDRRTQLQPSSDQWRNSISKMINPLQHVMVQERKVQVICMCSNNIYVWEQCLDHFKPSAHHVKIVHCSSHAPVRMGSLPPDGYDAHALACTEQLSFIIKNMATDSFMSLRVNQCQQDFMVNLQQQALSPVLIDLLPVQ